jgi:hypothetical protein
VRAERRSSSQDIKRRNALLSGSVDAATHNSKVRNLVRSPDFCTIGRAVLLLKRLPDA